jgi:tRNA A-37 threonylcarbamoyl transferase component Bud32
MNKNIIQFMTETCHAKKLSNNILHTGVLYVHKYLSLTTLDDNIDMKCLAISCLHLATKTKSSKYSISIEECNNVYKSEGYNSQIKHILEKFKFELHIQTPIEALLQDYILLEDPDYYKMIYLLHISLFYPHLIRDTKPNVLASIVYSISKNKPINVENSYSSIVLMQYIIPDDIEMSSNIQPLYTSLDLSKIDNNNNNNNKRKAISMDRDNNKCYKKYILINKIGKGAYAKVYNAIDLTTDSRTAIKKYLIDKRIKEQHYTIFNEISCLRRLQASPYIMPLHHVQVDDNLSIVLEMPLCDFSLSKYANIDIKVCMYQLLKAVEHCHKNNIIHRDIKPENIMIHSQNKIYLTDFNISCMDSSSKINKVCTTYYTLNYRPPEVLLHKTNPNRHFNYASDMWSVGCVFGWMLTKKQFLFNGKNEFEVFNTILSTIQTKNWTTEKITTDKKAAHLLEQFCQFIPEDRITAKSALDHPFFFD